MNKALNRSVPFAVLLGVAALLIILWRVSVKPAPVVALPYEQLQSVTVRVDVGEGCGTGVLVTRQVGLVKRTFVWTAGHVVSHLRKPDGTFKNATVYREERSNGEYAGGARTEARVIAYSDPDVGEDLALLEVLQDNFSSASAVFGSYIPSEVGTELIHVGCTLGLYNSVSRGIMSQTDRDILNTGRVFDQTSCIGYPGSSGGGVYTARDGKCIGLLVRGAGPGLNFIVPVRRMQEWAVRMKVLWALDPNLSVHTNPRRDLKPATDTPFSPCSTAISDWIRRIVQRINNRPTTYPLG